MRALSIIGIVMSLGGVLSAIYVMTETHCYCYNDDYFSDYSSTPEAATSGGVVMLLVSVFFLIFSIISTVISFGKKDTPVVAGPTPNYNQPYTSYPPYQQQPSYNAPAQNPYTQQYPNPLQPSPQQPPAN